MALPGFHFGGELHSWGLGGLEIPSRGTEALHRNFLKLFGFKSILTINLELIKQTQICYILDIKGKVKLLARNTLTTFHPPYLLVNAIQILLFNKACARAHR